MPLSPQEAQRLAELEAKYAPKSQNTLMPEEDTRLKELESKYGGGVPISDDIASEVAATRGPGAFRQALDYGARGLDYLGGIVRTGGAMAGGLLQGDMNKIVPEEDAKNALLGKAPSSAEYMKRLGVSEGPSAELPIFGHTSLRDAEGLGIDILSDPLTAVAKGLKGTGKLGKLVNPASELTEKVGEKTYKSAFKKIDERLVEKGKGSLGELLIKEGAPVGSTKEISKKAAKISENALAERKSLYDKAKEIGVSVDLSQPLTNTEKALSRIRDNPALAELANNIEEKMITPYKNSGKIDLERLSNWKSDLYNALPDSAFNNVGKIKGPAAQLQKALAKDFREMIIEAGNKGEAGLGDKIDKLNEKMSTLISAEKPTAMQIRREVTPNALTSVDAMIAGFGHAGVLPIKKLADVSKTAKFRTAAGKSLMKTGQSGAPDMLLRRGLINSNRGLLEE